MKNKIIKEFPRLYGIATNGKTKTVLYYVEQLPDGTCDIVNEYGYLDGAVKTDRRNIDSGKNIGKANETSIQEQAISEAQSKWNKKKDENYTENESGKTSKAETALLPMLAHKFQERKHNITYPCYVQPKLNGVRCMIRLVKDKYVITSRKFKEYTTLAHLDKHIRNVFGDNYPYIPDGEVYLHGLTLEEISRRVKKYRPGLTEQLQFWVFDIADENMTSSVRQALLSDKYINNSDFREDDYPIQYVKTYVCNTEAEVKEYHDKFVQAGFEGAIIRNIDAKYLFEKRSTDLQKYKEFLDDEFEIIGYTSGKGRETDAIIFTCAVKNPKSVKSFEVRPRGSIEIRREMMKNADKYIGKSLTVRYFALTELNVPQFPVGITVRDYE